MIFYWSDLMWKSGRWPSLFGFLQTCTDNLPTFWPKKVGFWPFLQTKSGHEKVIFLTKNGHFKAKIGVFRPFLGLFEEKNVVVAKWPLFFLINCENKILYII